MSAAISTTPAPAGGTARSSATAPLSLDADAAARDLRGGPDRETRFWASYATDPSSATAWADAAAVAWRTPVATTEKDLDRWNGEGGSDPD